MLIIPSIDIQNSKCVKLVQGKEGSEQVVLENPLEVAKLWERQGAKWLHIIDLDATFGKGNNTEIIKEIISKVKIPVEVGGGIRSEEIASEIINAGAKRIIIGTKAITDPNFIAKLSKRFGKDKIMIALDSKERKVVIKGWKESTGLDPIDTAKKLSKYCGSFLFTSVELEGLMAGLDFDFIKQFIKSIKLPIIISGGVGKLEDIKRLKKLGAAGVIIGMAFYKGVFSLKDAMKAAK